MAGYDLGNQTCTVTVLSNLETTNFLKHDSYYTMPSYLPFEDSFDLNLPFEDEHNLNSFLKISQIKFLLGRKFTDPELQSYFSTFPLKVTQNFDDFPLIHGIYTQKEATFTPTQLLAELISLLKLRAQENLKLDIVDCCIAVPVYFNELQRRALLDAANHAGLKPRMILNETTATALAYAFRKNGFHESHERNVVFVDIGQTSMQVCIAKFQKRKIKILSHAYDTSVGGRNFDEVLFKHLRGKYKIEVQNNVRESIKLLRQCEVLKAGLSSNPRVEFTIDAPLVSKEIKGFITRKYFNKMSNSLLDRVKDLLIKALKDASLSKQNISSVELVGLGSFMPVIIGLLTNFFHKAPNRTMETSKCVAVGCAIQCALLAADAPQLKGFQVHDTLPYSIALSWKLDNETDETRKVFFTKGTPIPSEKYLTIYSAGTFSLDIFYFDTGDSEIPQKIRTYEIGPFHSSTSKEVAVRVRVQLNINGIIFVDATNTTEEEREVAGIPVREKGTHEEGISTKFKEVVSVKEHKKFEAHAESSKSQDAQKIQDIDARVLDLDETERRKQEEDLAKKKIGHGNHENFLGKSSSLELRKEEEEELEHNHRNKEVLDAPMQVNGIPTSPHAKIEEELQKMRVQYEMLQKICSEMYNDRKAEQERTNSKLEHLVTSVNSCLEAIKERARAEEARSMPVLQHLRAESESEVLTNERSIVTKRFDGLYQGEEGQASGSERVNRAVINYCEFTHLELKKATANFSKKNIVGEGGSSIVYTGLLRHIPVAIKKLTVESRHTMKEFIREVEMCSRIRHPHLITLIGACEESLSLVFEYMPNGSLQDRLNRKNNTPPIPWQFRIRIALEICTALIFLHSIKPHGIAHGDFKPSNILLDSNYKSKVCDFGSVRPLAQEDFTLVPCHLTNLLHGTLEYMAPEYFSNGVLTTQCDVYSFGLVLLQLVTGLTVRLSPKAGITIRLRDRVQEAMQGANLDELVDKSAGEWPHGVAKKILSLGLGCTEESSKKRLDLTNEVLVVIKALEKASSRRGLFAPEVRC